MTEQENILSFAECLAKLDQIDKELTPEMVDVGTQTEITFTEIKQMEQDGGDLRQAINQYIPLTTYKKEAQLRLQSLDNTIRTYEQTQIYLKNEAKRDKGLISELMGQVKSKTLTEEQLIVKIRELEKKLVKPLMVDQQTETILTTEQISQMEQSIIKYQSDIQTEQNKASLLQTKMANLRQELKDLEKKLKEGELNEVEKELINYLKKGVVMDDNLKETELDISLWTEANYLLNKLQNDNKWNQLRGGYVNAYQKLISLCNKIKEKRELESQITILNEQKNQLQTQLDLATKTKEELAVELQIEKSWWDKWINVNDWEHLYGEKNSHSFAVNTSVWYKYDVVGKDRTVGIQISSNYDYKLALKNLIYQYYKNQR